MAKYLDLAGLASVWAKIKAALAKKQDALSQGTGIYIASGEVSKREADFWATINSGQYTELFKCAYTSTSNVMVKFSFACFSGNNKGMQFGTVAFKAYGCTMYEKASFWGGENLTADFGYRFGDDGYIHVYARQAGSGTVRLRGSFDNSNNGFNSTNCVPVNGSAETRTDVTMIASQRYVSAATDGAVGSSTTPVFVDSDGTVKNIGVAQSVSGDSPYLVTSGAVYDAISALGTESYSIDSGSSSTQCAYLGRTTDGITVDNIYSVSAVVILRTLTTTGTYTINVHSRPSSSAFNYTIECEGRTADQGLKLAVTQSGAVRNIYILYDTTPHASVKVIPQKTTFALWAPTFISDSEVIAALKTVQKEPEWKLNVDGSNGTAAGVSALINKLTTGSDVPSGSDYYVSQYAGGGTSTTTYHRRPMSALASYVRSTQGSAGSSTVPVYFSNGMPKACDMSGYAAPVSDYAYWKIKNDCMAYYVGSKWYWTAQVVSVTSGYASAYFWTKSSGGTSKVLDVLQNVRYARTGNVGFIYGEICPRPDLGGIDGYFDGTTLEHKASEATAFKIILPDEFASGLGIALGRVAFTGSRGFYVSFDAAERSLVFTSDGNFANYTRGTWYPFMAECMFL